MQSGIEKVTLSLDKELLQKMAKRAKKSRSEFVRDLIQREASLIENEFTLSQEILELKGSLEGSRESTKTRLHDKAKQRLRDYERV